MPDYSCSVCGTRFRSFNPRPQFCSLACKGRSQTAKINIREVVLRYERGETQDEIAAALHTTQKVIHNAMRRAGYKCRVAAKRDQRREKNATWRGDRAGYAGFHARLYRERGRPQCCEVCGTDDPSKTYDWANLTGHYEDSADYKRMCRSCHWRYDGKIENIRCGKAA